MKAKITILFILTLIFTLSCTASLPLVLDENNAKPLNVWVDNPPNIVGNKAEKIVLKYDWNGKKSEFEKMQNAVGEITYKIQGGKFAAGRHNYGASIKYDLEEKGEFKFYFSSNVEEGNATGTGRLMLNLTCSYKDKDGNKHKGWLGGVTLNVTFKKD